MIRSWRLSRQYSLQWCHRLGPLATSQTDNTLLSFRRGFHSTAVQIEPDLDGLSENLEISRPAEQLQKYIQSRDYDAFQACLVAISPDALSKAKYQHLMKACSQQKSSDAIAYALDIYRTSVNTRSMLADRGALNSMLYFLMLCFIHCDDLSKLFDLKTIWLSSNEKELSLLPLYYTAFIHYYLNTGQAYQAEEIFEKAFDDLNENLLSNIASHTLPSKRLLESLIDLRDCEALTELVRLIGSEEAMKLQHNQRSIFEENVWLDILQVGIQENNYNLVKLILDSYIMKDFQAGVITSDDVLLNTKVPELFQNQSLSDELVYLILHTLASNGDVPLTLAMIESFYIHRAMRGEKALTKKLYLKVIEAYCSHLTEDEEMKASNGDPGVKRVIDVIGGLNQRYKHDKAHQISYKDITNAMSEKFIKFRMHDRKVETIRQKRQQIEQRIKESELNDIITTVKPRKVTNPNIHVASKGNILANIEILEAFTREHVEYIQVKQFSLLTILLFINCLLNHVNLYQNFSGMVRLLNVLQKINPTSFHEWLDEDLFDIVLNSMSNSNTGKPSAFILYDHMRRRFGRITHEQYAMLLGSVLRGDFHQELEYFLFNYLIEHGSEIHPKIGAQIDSIPSTYTNSTLSQILDLLDQTPSTQEVENFWEVHGLQKSPPIIKSTVSLPGFERKYFHDLAKRDAKYLQFALS